VSTAPDGCFARSDVARAHDRGGDIGAARTDSRCVQVLKAGSVGAAAWVLADSFDGALARSMLDRRDAVETPLGALARSTKCEGKGQVVMRPDTSQVRGLRAVVPGGSAVAAVQRIAEDDCVSVARTAWLSAALAGLAEELAVGRREIASLQREKVGLRCDADQGSRDFVIAVDTR